MALSENIKKRRIKLKMSQEYIADQLGISRQAVAKWENGKSEPSAANLAELAAVLETSVSDLVEIRQTNEEIQKKDKIKERHHNSKMLAGRFIAVCLVNAGWDGYSSGLYAKLPLYWLALLGIGILLMFITSIDMNKKHQMDKIQIMTGSIMIISIFFLPRMLPFHEKGMNYFLSDIVTAICVIYLDLKYWRYIWKIK